MFFTKKFFISIQLFLLLFQSLFFAVDEEKVVIVGSGPAGLTAAIYAARAGLEPLLVEGPSPGGQLTLTFDIENYPGFPRGVMGNELIDLMHQQAERFGTRFRHDILQEVDFTKYPYELNFCWGGKMLCRSLIIATGASAKWLGLESETKLLGKGVSGCAICDAFFFRDKDVVVVGGGDAALEEALYLTSFARNVTIVHRRKEFRAAKYLQEQVFANDKIGLVLNSVVDDIYDVDKDYVTGVLLRDVSTQKQWLLSCDGVFISIGHKPNTEIFSGILDLDDNGYIVTKGKSMATNIPGVFVAGDVGDPRYRQAVTAAGMGCMAALDAYKFLSSQK